MLQALVISALVAVAVAAPAGPPAPAPYAPPPKAYRPAPYAPKAAYKEPPAQPFAYQYGVKDDYSGNSFDKSETQVWSK